MSLGEKLKDIRVKNGLSMDELSNRLNKNYNLNISKSMISRWENNKSEPINTFLAAYAKEFSIDLNYLLGISDNIQKPKVVAAHSDRNLTKEEQEKVMEYIKFLMSQRNEE